MNGGMYLYHFNQTRVHNIEWEAPHIYNRRNWVLDVTAMNRWT